MKRFPEHILDDTADIEVSVEDGIILSDEPVRVTKSEEFYARLKKFLTNALKYVTLKA